MNLLAVLLALSVTAANAFSGAPGACVTGSASTEAAGSPHAGFGAGTLQDGGISLSIGGIEPDEFGMFFITADSSFDLVMQSANAFHGFLILVSPTGSFTDSTGVVSLDTTANPLASISALEGTCPSTVGYVCHTNPNKEDITELTASLMFDSSASGEPVPLEVNVVVNATSWFYSTYSIFVAPIASTEPPATMTPDTMAPATMAPATMTQGTTAPATMTPATMSPATMPPATLAPVLDGSMTTEPPVVGTMTEVPAGTSSPEAPAPTSGTVPSNKWMSTVAMLASGAAVFFSMLM